MNTGWKDIVVATLEEHEQKPVIVPEDGEDYPVDDLISYAKCPCGQELSWSYDENCCWYAECDCGRKFDSAISKVTVWISEPDNEEEDEDVQNH